MRGVRAIAALACLALGVIALDRICPPDLSRLRTQSLLLLDRDGKPLDAVLAPDGRWRLAATPADIDPLYLRLLLATEDRHFDIHPGVDPVALARAALQFAVRGRVVSGGSTLTMQVARLLMPHRRDMAGKLVEIARALQLEWRFGKWRILSMYLTLAPMGGNIEGVRAGALAWFGHGPGHLTAPEAALLVALPRSPARFRPDRHPKAAIKAAARVLDASALPSSDLEAPVRHPVPHAAYHLAERLGRRSGAVITTVDGGLQRAIDRLATAEPAADGGEIAVLVVRNADRAVLGYLGGHANGAAGGDVDMVRAVRSPGSTLKPFVYAMAIDAGLLRPDTLVDDAALQVGGWAPHDFDGGFRGTVTVREALQQSLNAPAVRVLDRVGPARFAAALRDAGAPLVLPPGAAASLPIVLGGAGIRLADLAILYAGLADDGRAAPLRLLREDPLPVPRPFIGAAAARAVGAILRAAPLPDGIGAPDRPVAFKTGTSFGFRDAWAAGFSPRYTVVRLDRPRRRHAAPGPVRRAHRGTAAVSHLRPAAAGTRRRAAAAAAGGAARAVHAPPRRRRDGARAEHRLPAGRRRHRGRRRRDPNRAGGGRWRAALSLDRRRPAVTAGRRQHPRHVAAGRSGLCASDRHRPRRPHRRRGRRNRVRRSSPCGGSGSVWRPVSALPERLLDMFSCLRRLAFCAALLGGAPAWAARHHATHPMPGTGPVTLSIQPGPLTDAARELEAHDIAQSVTGGQEPLILVGSARLSTAHNAPSALFVQLQSAALCGSAGCDTSVYLNDRGQWVRVLDSVSGPITVLPSWHGRMHDLMVGTNDRWVWAGHSYHDTVAAPALTGLKRSVERHQAAVARGDAGPPK